MKICCIFSPIQLHGRFTHTEKAIHNFFLPVNTASSSFRWLAFALNSLATTFGALFNFFRRRFVEGAYENVSTVCFTREQLMIFQDAEIQCPFVTRRLINVFVNRPSKRSITFFYLKQSEELILHLVNHRHSVLRHKVCATKLVFETTVTNVINHTEIKTHSKNLIITTIVNKQNKIFESINRRVCMFIYVPLFSLRSRCFPSLIRNFCKKKNRIMIHIVQIGVLDTLSTASDDRISRYKNETKQKRRRQLFSGK